MGLETGADSQADFEPPDLCVSASKQPKIKFLLELPVGAFQKCLVCSD